MSVDIRLGSLGQIVFRAGHIVLSKPCSPIPFVEKYFRVTPEVVYG
jgi:hypothetical protein